MKTFVEKYTENARKLHFDVEVKDMLNAVKLVDGVEFVSSSSHTERYNFTIWIGKCFDIDTVVENVIKVCQEVSGSDPSCPVLRENGLSELLDWVPHKEPNGGFFAPMYRNKNL